MGAADIPEEFLTSYSEYTGISPDDPAFTDAFGTIAAQGALSIFISHTAFLLLLFLEPAHLDRLFAETTIRPVANQIQLSPYITRSDHVAYDRAHDIVTVSWSPLGQGKGLLEDQTLATIAAKYDKTPAQIVLRWNVELGLVAIPRSSNPERLAQNLDLFDFALTADELAAISALDTGAEKRVDSDTMGH